MSFSVSSNKLTDTFTIDPDSNNASTPFSHYIIHDAFTVLVSEHAFLAGTHNTLCANYRNLERELRWYSDALLAVHTDYQKLGFDYQDLDAAYRALEAERDNAARRGLKAKRGLFGGGIWGREKMGEVWKMQGEFVWVKVEERGWVKMAKERLEGIKGCGKKGRKCLGEAREKCMEKMVARRRRSVVRVTLREDLSL